MSKYKSYQPFEPMTKDILKYLINFRKLKKHAYPGFDESNSLKEWNDVLDKMIYAFKAIDKDDVNYNYKNNLKINDGLNLFAKYFRDLWD